MYGLGEGEITLGEGIGSNRNKVIIASKFGVRVENGKTFYDNSPEWINKAIEQSLKRLKTDCIDLYQIHYRDNKTSIVDVIETLELLKQKALLGITDFLTYIKKILRNYKNMLASSLVFKMNIV